MPLQRTRSRAAPSPAVVAPVCVAVWQSHRQWRQWRSWVCHFHHLQELPACMPHGTQLQLLCPRHLCAARQLRVAPPLTRHCEGPLPTPARMKCTACMQSEASAYQCCCSKAGECYCGCAVLYLYCGLAIHNMPLPAASRLLVGDSLTLHKRLERVQRAVLVYPLPTQVAGAAQ